MSENLKETHQEVSKNRHGIATAAGIAFCIAFGLVTRNDLLFGLVMASVYGAGMKAGVKISQMIDKNQEGPAVPAKITGQIAFAILVGLIIAVVQGTGAVTPMQDDNIIIAIIKHFFDLHAAVLAGIGALVGGYLHGMHSD
ncbi:MAG: hypothetical protein OXG78_00230 [Chloroflexi bacterium]|nr:hypothetical protein [Chloroflexota bacterium]